MSKQVQIIVTDPNAGVATLKERFQKNSPQVQDEIPYLQYALGFYAERQGSLSVQCLNGDSAAASGTLTLSSVVATNTCAVNGVTFTAVASGASGNQFNVGVDDSHTATNLAAAISASVSAGVAGLVSASAVGAVVTVTASLAGTSGNGYTLTGSANIAASGARMTGGLNDSASIKSYTR